MDAIGEYCREKNVDAEFYAFDINKGAEELKRVLGPQQFDVVTALSIWSHVDKAKLWDIIETFCNDVLYFEDNCPSRVGSLKEIERQLRENLKFFYIEFLGFTTDRGVRPIFLLKR